jgi:hypothetical protein
LVRGGERRSYDWVRTDFAPSYPILSPVVAGGNSPNMSEHSTRDDPETAKPPPPTRGQRLAAAAFLGAFGLTILTVLLTGLRVGAPSARHLLGPSAGVAAGAGTPAVASEPAPASAASLPAAAPSDVAAPPPANGAPSVDEPRADEDPGRADVQRDDPALEDAEREGDDSTRKRGRTNGAGDPPANATR